MFLEQRIDLIVGVHQAICRCRCARFGLGLHLRDLIMVSLDRAGVLGLGSGKRFFVAKKKELRVAKESDRDRTFERRFDFGRKSILLVDQ
jgi:hypothetical protein